MKLRTLVFSSIILSSIVCVFANKKISVRNSETGESFEVLVADGMKIYEYNNNRIDSIPYLIERARYGEPWAYEALGDCYLLEKGDVERSVFKAIAYYILAGIDPEKKAFDFEKENSGKYLNLTFQLIDNIENKDREGALQTIELLDDNGFHDANIVKEFIGETSMKIIPEMTKQYLKSMDVSADKMMLTLMGLGLQDWFWEMEDFQEEVFETIAMKFSFMGNHIAESLYSKGFQYMDSTRLAEKKEVAIALLEIADKEAMLSRHGATILYDFYISEADSGRMILNPDEMKRLATLARLTESETFIFRDK